MGQFERPFAPPSVDLDLREPGQTLAQALGRAPVAHGVDQRAQFGTGVVQPVVQKVTAVLEEDRAVVVEQHARVLRGGQGPYEGAFGLGTAQVELQRGLLGEREQFGTAVGGAVGQDGRTGRVRMGLGGRTLDDPGAPGHPQMQPGQGRRVVPGVFERLREDVGDLGQRLAAGVDHDEPGADAVRRAGGGVAEEGVGEGSGQGVVAGFDGGSGGVAALAGGGG